MHRLPSSGEKHEGGQPEHRALRASLVVVSVQSRAVRATEHDRITEPRKITVAPDLGPKLAEPAAIQTGSRPAACNTPIASAVTQGFIRTELAPPQSTYSD